MEYRCKNKGSEEWGEIYKKEECDVQWGDIGDCESCVYWGK